MYKNLAEQTVRDSSYDELTQRKPYNPDDLYQQKGDYEIYESMMKDEQVSVAMQLKKDLVIGSGWEIISEDEGQEDIVEFLSQTLTDDVEEPIEDQLEGIVSAYEYGFSLSEKIFKKRLADSKLTLKNIKTRYPDSWLIHTDEKGNIEKIEQRGVKNSVEVNPEILIHYINNPKFQNPYGTSDLRPAYQAWFSKTHLMRYYSIFLEKAAGPIPVAKYKTGASKDAVEKIFDTIKRFQAKTAIAVPDSITLDFLKSENQGDAYVKGLNIFNMFIGRALFIPDLLGFQGGETAGGAYALGKEHMNLFFRHINRRRAKLEGLINKHIIQPIIEWNFGAVENAPKFRFKPLSDEAATEYAKLWLEAVKGKFYKPNDEEIQHFRQLVKFPDGDVEREEPPAPLQPATGQDGKPLVGDDKGVKEAGQKVDDKTNKPNENAEPEEKKFKAYTDTDGDYSKKVNFKALEAQLDNAHNTIVAEARPVVKEIIQDLIDQVEKKKIIQAQKVERIEDLKLKYLKKLQVLLKSNFREHFKKNQLLAQEELFGTKNFREPLPTEQFLDFLETETYKFIGDWEYRVTAQAKQEIIKAIKDGKPLSSVLDMIEQDGTDAAMVSLERYARTKETEVMNRARMDYFESTGVVEGYQYSAIMDAVTSDICAGLHGKVFPKGSEAVPPLHFNCRSTLIPITRFEDAKYPSDSELTKTNAFIEKHIGQGFSKR